MPDRQTSILTICIGAREMEYIELSINTIRMVLNFSYRNTTMSNRSRIIKFSLSYSALSSFTACYNITSKQVLAIISKNHPVGRYGIRNSSESRQGRFKTMLCNKPPIETPEIIPVFRILFAFMNSFHN